MTAVPEIGTSRDTPILISVDAMGGDKGAATVVAGMAHSAKKNPEIGFVLHGRRDELEPLVARRKELAGRVDLRDERAIEEARVD